MSELEKLDIRRPRPRLRIALLALLSIVAVLVAREAVRWSAEQRARDELHASLPEMRAVVVRLEACVLGSDRSMAEWSEHLVWRALSLAAPETRFSECAATARSELAELAAARLTEPVEALLDTAASLSRDLREAPTEPFALAATVCRGLERTRDQLVRLERAGGEYSGQAVFGSPCAGLDLQGPQSTGVPAVAEPAGLRTWARTGYWLSRGRLVAGYERPGTDADGAERKLARFAGGAWEIRELPTRSVRAMWPDEGAFAVLRGAPQELWAYRDLTWQHLADIPGELQVRGMAMTTTGVVMVAVDPAGRRWFAIRSSEDLTTLQDPVPLTPAPVSDRHRRRPAERCWHHITSRGDITLVCERRDDPTAIRVHRLPAQSREVRRRLLPTRAGDTGAGEPGPGDELLPLDLCAAGELRWLNTRRGELLVSRDQGATWRRHPVPALEGGVTRCDHNRWLWVGRLPGDDGFHHLTCTAGAGCEAPRRVGNPGARAAIPSTDGSALLVFAHGGGAVLLEDPDRRGELGPTQVFARARLGDPRTIPAWNPGGHLFVKRPLTGY